MDPTNPLPSIAWLLAAIATAALLVRWQGAPPPQGRFVAIDGLRGYLALLVFFDHAYFWYFYLRTGNWRTPDWDLYAFFGTSGVAVFFMITAFLFFSKLLDARERGIDWTRLFVSRILRLTPLYLFVMLALLLIVAVLSRGVPRQPLPDLARSIGAWLGFTLFGSPNINAVPWTFVIVAGVTWSLPYEWFFYFSLPALALLLWIRVPRPYVFLGIVALIGFAQWHPQLNPLVAFLGGICASLLARSVAIERFARTTGASFAILALITGAFAAYPSQPLLGLVQLSAAFALIAAGNDLFGALVAPPSRLLGEISYSVYLMHGMVLFVVFTFVIGADQARTISPAAHWALITALCPLLIAVSAATFRLIERPAMQQTDRLTRYLRELVVLHDAVEPHA